MFVLLQTIEFHVECIFRKMSSRRNGDYCQTTSRLNIVEHIQANSIDDLCKLLVGPVFVWYRLSDFIFQTRKLHDFAIGFSPSKLCG